MADYTDLERAGVPMDRALTSVQCERMRRFFRALAWAAGKCYQAGIRPDVMAAIRAWGNRPPTRQTGPRKGTGPCSGSAGD